MLMIFLAAQAAASSPPRVVLPPAPPPVYVPTVFSAEATAAKYVVDVEVRSGANVLWSGPLRVGGGYGQTSVRRDQSEPGDAACAPGQPVAPIATSFSLSLGQRGQEDTLYVNVRWSRPGDQSCGSGPNVRSVELSATAALAAGQTVTLTGDGGLVIRLRRR